MICKSDFDIQIEAKDDFELLQDSTKNANVIN